MARGREETSTSSRPGGRPRATPSTSSIITSLTMKGLVEYCEVLDNIDLKLVDGPDESTLSGEHNGVFFTRSGAPRSRATLSCASHSQTISAFYPGAPGPCAPQRDSYLNRLLHIEPPVQT